MPDFKELKNIDCRKVAPWLGIEVNRQGKAHCFLHTGDNDPSLQFYRDGWHCFGCGAHGDAVDLVARYRGISAKEAAEQLQDAFLAHHTSASREKSHFEAEFFYKTVEGPPLKKIVWRYEDGEKKTPWCHKVGDAWKDGANGLTPCLYDNGVESPGFVYVAEGEKCVTRLGELGIHAVTLPNGAQSSWKDIYAPTFEGLDVIVVLDNDDPGRKYGNTVATNTYKVAKKVKILDLSKIWPGIPPKGDIADLIDKFGADEAARLLVHLETETPVWEPEKEPDIFDSFGFYSVPDLTEEERRPPEFIIDGMIPCGMTFLSGAPKIRKTFMALQMAIAVATGKPFWGHHTIQCDVAYQRNHRQHWGNGERKPDCQSNH